MEEKGFMVNDEVAGKIADRLARRGIADDINQSRVNFSFSLPREKWEADLALNSLDMALALNELSMQASYHRYEQDEAEYAFWNRLSKEVNKVLEDYNIFELVTSRSI